MHHFLALLYKGLQLRKRHYMLTISEILIPTLIVIIPAIVKSAQISQKSKRYERIGEPFSATEKFWKWEDKRTYPSFRPFDYLSKHAVDDLLFAYTPPNNFTEKLVMDSIALWKNNVKVAYSNATIRKFANEEEMENFCLHMRTSFPSKTIIGTVFNNFNSITDFPTSLDYKIRYAHDDIGYFSQVNVKYRDERHEKENVYTNSLFLGWQAAVEETFISYKMQGKEIKYKVRMQQFPVPAHRKVTYQERQHENHLIFLSWSIAYGFLFFIISLIKKVTEEKANGSKELLKMMGMTDGFYWCSTFADYFGVGAIMILVITIVYKSPLKYYSVFVSHSNFFLLLLLLLLFLVNLILFSMAFTTFFNRVIFAVIGIVVVFNIVFLPIALLCFPDRFEISTYLRLPLDARLAICLFPPGALLTIFHMVREYELIGEGIQWSNIIQYGVVHDMTLLTVIGMMVLSCFMYIVIIWYIDAVWPWQYGIPKPFYFPFTKSYWCGYKPKNIEEFRLVDHELNSDFFEDERRDSTPGIIINNLSKVFRTGTQKKLALNQISLNIYIGQITVLLGHNGAGKSTTLNILTGLFPPSSGTAHINGWNILTHSADSRKSLGVCPQHDALYDSLSVEEHLKIYAALKGVRWSNITNESSNILNMLNLQDKRNALVRNLSVGMKRKLSLGIAIIGDSKVLILDEPTAGMDVKSRQNVWNALLDSRPGRTVILTTHYMDEAEILGDRIAIMTEGEIQCCGSPSFLKRKFGAGYHFHIAKAENFDLNTVTRLLQEYAPGSTVALDTEKEITFYLPVNGSASYGDLFDKLESLKDDFGFTSCRITVTTLEDVYLNIANISDKELKIQENKDLKDAVVLNSEGIYDLNQAPRSRKFTMQLRGLLIKRLHHARRNRSILFAQVILPIMIMVVCLCIIPKESSLRSYSYPHLKLNIKHLYGRTDGFYKTNEDKITTHLKNIFGENYISAKNTNNPNKYVMEYGTKSFSRYERKFLVGTSIENVTDDSLIITAWYNDKACHSAPISLLLCHTSVLRYVSGTGSIHLTNAPLPGGKVYLTDIGRRMIERNMTGILVPLAFAFLSASFVLLPSQERTSKAKLLQFMAGVTAPVYWLSMFIWDLFIQFIVCLLLLIPLAIFNFPVFFTHFEPIGILILLTMMYGWASIPFSYLFTFCCKKNTSAFLILVMISAITGMIIATTLNFFKIIAEEYNYKFPPLELGIWIFRVFPSFCVSSGFSKLFAIAYDMGICYDVPKKNLDFLCSVNTKYEDFVNICCKDPCQDNCFRQYLEWNYDTCAYDIMMLFVDGIIYFWCLLALEARTVEIWLVKYKKHESGYHGPMEREIPLTRAEEDSDVISEQERILNIHSNDSAHEAIMIYNLSKSFKNLCAVDRLTFGIHQGECFGLLGVNGSGKTTTFRMLTGDCIPSEGNAIIKNFTLMTDFKKFRSFIGYCPQFDIIMDYLTGREVLSLFARLNGFDGKSMENRVDALIKMLDFNEADKQSQFYCRGSKRKLSIGIAVIGSPPLIFLDEPTAGVDVVSRKKIWDIISQARIKTGSAVMLATHSMKECEALCDRLGIMVNGRFRCLGSIEELKSKYGKGYTLTVKTKREAREDLQAMGRIKAFVLSNLPGIQLKVEHQDMLQYHIVDPTISLSSLFKLMDEMKTQFDLQDCLISDTSLEQVFLAMSRAQIYSA